MTRPGVSREGSRATSTTILEGLKDPANRTVWRDYVERYRPPIVGYAVRRGVPLEEAEDVAQSALLAFSKALRDGRYAREHGRLSAWLFGIATREVAAWRRAAERRRERVVERHASGDVPLAHVAATQAETQAWAEEWRASILRRCLEEIRGEVSARTLAAFRRFALEGRPAEEVARELGMSANAVFGAKRRVLRRVRELLPLMEEDG